MAEHPTGLDMSGLVLMGMPNCSGCVIASNWLDGQDLPFRKYDVSTSAHVVKWLIETTGQRSVPQFFLNGHHLPGGFDQVRQMAAMGQLPRPRVTQLG